MRSLLVLRHAVVLTVILALAAGCKDGDSDGDAIGAAPVKANPTAVGPGADATLSTVTLEDAVAQASKTGVVYWANSTVRDARSGYGVYVLGPDKKTHYFFVS